jgi:hypothetical protein
LYEAGLMMDVVHHRKRRAVSEKGYKVAVRCCAGRML